MRWSAAIVAIVVMRLAACGNEPVRDDLQDLRDGGPQATIEAPDRPDRPDRNAQQKIIAFGDSLTAGFGIPHDEAYRRRSKRSSMRKAIRTR